MSALARAQLAMLAVARRDLQLTESAYRSILGRCAGVFSARDLDQAGFAVVLAELQRLGFKPGRASRPAKRDGREINRMATESQLEAIRHAWLQYTGRCDDERELHAWIERHFHVSHPRFLTKVVAGKCLGILRNRLLSWRASRGGAA